MAGDDGAGATMDPETAAEMLEAVKEALCQLDPTHSQTDKDYPDGEGWAFGWSVEPTAPTEARRAWIEVHAMQIAKGIVNSVGRGRRLRLASACTGEGYGSLAFKVKPVPGHPMPPGGEEELGPQLVQEVAARLRQMTATPSLFTAVPEGLAEHPYSQRFRLLARPGGVDACVADIRDALEPDTSYYLSPYFADERSFYVVLHGLVPAAGN